MCEEEGGKLAGKAASLGGLTLKFMIVLNMCRALQHSPGFFPLLPPVGFDAWSHVQRLQLTMALTQQERVCVCVCVCTRVHVGVHIAQAAGNEGESLKLEACRLSRNTLC